MSGRRQQAPDQQQEPPHDLQAEAAVLGGLLLDRDAIAHVADRLAPADFYRAAHGALYAAILALYERREPPDLVTITAELERRGTLDDVGGLAALTAFAAATPTAVHVTYHADLVAQASALRRLISVGVSLVNASYRNGADPQAVLARAQEALLGASVQGQGRDFITLGEALGGSLARLDRLAAPGGRQHGVPSGFADLDRITGGWQAQDLVILAARPAVGKSAFALAMAKAAARSGRAVAFFSLEMGIEALVLRLLAAEAAVPLTELRDATLTPHQWFRVTQATISLASLPIFFTDSTPLTVDQIRARVGRLAQHVPLGLVVVDYLQLVSGRGNNRQEEVGGVSRGLKIMAKESRTPVIALAQLNRAAEARDIPQLRDLRESGSIEQDADIVAFLHRDEVQDATTARRGLTEVHFAKHRNGPLGVVALRSDMEIGRYGNTAHTADD